MNEWDADVLRGDKIEVPEEHQRRMRYQVILVTGSGPAGLAWCAAVQFHPVGNVLEIQDVLMDTSQKFEGITIKARVTYHTKILLWGLGAIIVPYRYKREGEPGEGT